MLVASAAEPMLVVTDAGTVRGQVVVTAPLEQVRSLLTDPRGRLAVLASEGTEATLEPDGPCTLERTHVAHPVKAVSYTVRSCPTDDGLKSALVESADLARLTSVWTVTAVEGGTLVTYELDAVPSFPLPAFVARMSTKSGVSDALAAIARHFAP